MKKTLFTLLMTLTLSFAYSQTYYYWVGGTANPTAGINTTSNWNTSLDGSGGSRVSNTDATDVLVFDGTNLGGAAPAVGPATITANSSITCGQMVFTNNANVTMTRPTGGTSTITIAGGFGEDFVVNAGSAFIVNSPVGSIRFTLQSSVDACRVSGSVSLITTQQIRFENGTSGTPGTFIFKSGSSFTTNITSSSSSYAFGNSSQSSNNWVVFESGSHLYYAGGYSPEGSGTLFSAIKMQPGSVWHHRANNATAGGNFFNRQSYGDIIVENNSTLTASSSIYRIGNLTINNGCSFVPNTTGQTVVLGNLTVNGDYTSPAGGTNTLVLAGNAAQVVSGTGPIALSNFTVADKANVTLNKNIAVETSVNIYGKLNFGTNQITGTAAFGANGLVSGSAGSGNLIAGNSFISGSSTLSSSSIGQSVSGTGIAPNTSIVSFSTTADSVFLSQPLIATGTAVALSVSTSGATLQTASTNGFNPATGSVVTTGNRNFDDDINYIFDAATTSPLGISTTPLGSMINVGSIEVNAPVTINSGLTVKNSLLINAKLTLRPSDLLHILAGGNITGSFSGSKYIVTDYITATGAQSIVRIDGISSAKTIPIGTANFYLPVTVTPTSASDFSFNVFQGITTNGLLTGTPFTATQRLRVVNAAWNILRINGTGSAGLQLEWVSALEGTTFNTLPDSDIGLIKNTGTAWAPPVGTGNNTTNMVTGTVTSFGNFGAGAIPQLDAFVFNDLPTKTYGNPDFGAGATSLNTDKPITYTSSNTSVATIVGSNIHIVGAGTSNITASQLSDGFYPDTSSTKILTVNKAPLQIKADDKLKFEGVANPTLTVTYTSFVLGETPAVFTTPLVINTTATTASAPGTYPITPSAAVAANYAITFVNGTMTVQPKQNQVITFAQPATKTYGNAAFPTGATSTNATIPITYTSSNATVATVTGNTINIIGAGTTTITAMQVGNDGYFAATPVARVLTVNKVNLTIRAIDTTKAQGEANPAFRMTYTGFVLGETSANLTTAPVATTAATTTSAPGYYDIVPTGTVSQNYNLTITNGRLTVLPPSGTSSQYLLAYRNAAGNIAVRVYSPETYLADIIVYDMNGRILATRNILMPAGFAYAEIPAQFLGSGNYIVAVRGSGVKLEKVIYFIK